ncbi:MAG: site-2 protease family protein [Rhodomicrobium sp.]
MAFAQFAGGAEPPGFAIVFAAVWPATLLASFLLGSWAGIVFHEAGHFICAKLTGLPVRFVRAGGGPALRFRLHETEFSLGLLPAGGYVMLYPALDFHRGRQTLFTLGGVLGNVLLLFLLAKLDGGLPDDSPAHAIPWVMMSAQILLIVSSVIPGRLKAMGKDLSSDGRTLLKIWLNKPPHLRLHWEATLSQYGGAGALAATDAARARILYHHLYAESRGSAAAREESNAALERELQRGGLTPPEELLVLDMLVTIGLFARDPALHGKMDVWSQRAFAIGEDLPTIRGSRGSVLCLLGRHGEARAMLETVLADGAVSPFDALMTKIFMARASAGLGEMSEASRLIGEARVEAPAAGAEPRVLSLVAAMDAEIRANTGQECYPGGRE